MTLFEETVKQLRELHKAADDICDMVDYSLIDSGQFHRLGKAVTNTATLLAKIDTPQTKDTPAQSFDLWPPDGLDHAVKMAREAMQPYDHIFRPGKLTKKTNEQLRDEIIAVIRQGLHVEVERKYADSFDNNRIIIRLILNGEILSEDSTSLP